MSGSGEGAPGQSGTPQAAFRRRTGAASEIASSVVERHVSRLAAIHDSMPVAVACWSIEGVLLRANPVFADLVGARQAELPGRRFEEFLDPQAVSAVVAKVDAIWDGQRVAFECPMFAVRPDGSTVHLRAHVAPVYGPTARPAYFLSHVFDFTPAELTDGLARAADQAPVLIWLTDEFGIPRAGNAASHAFVGEPVVGGDLSRALFEHLHADDYLRARAELEGKPAGSPAAPERFVTRAIDAGGEWRWLEHRVAAVRDDEGNLEGWAGVSLDVTDLEEARSTIEEDRRLFHSVIETGPVAVARLDRSGRVTYVNGRWGDLLDDHEIRLRGLEWQSLFPPGQIEDLLERGLRSRSTGRPFTVRVQTDLLSGTRAMSSGDEPGRFWVELRVAPVQDSDGRPDGWVATLTDVSGEMAAGSRADRLARVLDAGSDFLMLVERDGTISYVNEAARSALGVSDGEDGQACSTLAEVLDADSLDHVRGVVDAVLSETGIWRGELVLGRPDGEGIPVSAVLVAHRDAGGQVESVSVVARDISDLKEAQGQMLHAATHDYLTGLPNRLLFYDRLEQALARHRRYGQPVALLFLDLDRFKPVNDQLGHHVGDAVLVEVADRIHREIRETDTAARVGGDEFAVLVEGVGDPAQLDSMAQRLIDTLRRPVEVSGANAEIGVSIGMVAVDGETDISGGVDGLMALADSAMYRAKAAGRGCFVRHRRGTP